MTWRWLIPLSALPVLGLLAYGFRVNPREIPSPLIGQSAGGFELETFQNKRLSLHSLHGNVVVVNFWASWCYPACYEEAPGFEWTWRAYRDRGVTIIGIDIQDTPAAAQKFIRDFGLTFPTGPDPGGRVSIDYGVYGVPETFFLDRQGRIRVKHVGVITEETLRGQVDRLLAESR